MLAGWFYFRVHIHDPFEKHQRRMRLILSYVWQEVATGKTSEAWRSGLTGMSNRGLLLDNSQRQHMLTKGSEGLRFLTGVWNQVIEDSPCAYELALCLAWMSGVLGAWLISITRDEIKMTTS